MDPFLSLLTGTVATDFRNDFFLKFTFQNPDTMKLESFTEQTHSKDIDILKRSLDAANMAIAGYQARVAGLETALAEAKGRSCESCRNPQTNSDESRQDAEKLKQENSNLKLQLSQKDKKLLGFRSEVVSIREEYARLKECLSKNDVEADNLSTKSETESSRSCSVVSVSHENGVKRKRRKPTRDYHIPESNETIIQNSRNIMKRTLPHGRI